MRKFLLFVLVILAPYAYGDEEITFGTMLGAPWVVANSVTGRNETNASVVKDLYFVTVTAPQTGPQAEGEISITGNGSVAQLNQLYLRENAILQDTDKEQTMLWSLQGSDSPAKRVEVQTGGTVKVKTYILTNTKMVFNGDSDLLAVKEPVENADTWLSLPQMDVVGLSAQKVKLDNATWYDYRDTPDANVPQPRATMEWKQCTGSGTLTCGSGDGSVTITPGSSNGVQSGDYILIGK